MPSSSVLIKEVTVELGGLPAALGGLRIAHISDFHYRRWNRVIQNAYDHLSELKYDLLLVTGDFGTSLRKWPPTVEFIRRFFEPLAQRCPVYASLGNHDHPDLTTSQDLPIQFLNNESTTLDIKGAKLELAGVAQSPYQKENLSAALPDHSTLDSRDSRESRESRSNDSDQELDVTVLLAHYPSTIYRLPPGRVQLQLSGHTHGGQICFPFVGCVWPHDKIPRHMASGLHLVGDTYLNVSAGIGVAPPIFLRILCPPEISIIQFARQN